MRSSIQSRNGSRVRITGTPARHGPAGLGRGPVVGFVLQEIENPDFAVYVSGDTVWYEEIAGFAGPFSDSHGHPVHGRSPRPEAGPWHITITAADALEFAAAFRKRPSSRCILKGGCRQEPRWNSEQSRCRPLNTACKLRLFHLARRAARLAGV